MQRRELFSSLAKTFKPKSEQERVIRPPYYDDENLFFTNCIECIDKSCSKVCEENIIVIQEDETPRIEFLNGGCTYCDLCAINCPKGVLVKENKKQIEAKIEIDVLSCLSWQQTMCFSCKDPCLDNAIDFLAMFRPTINNNCTNCGFCVRICPTNAIKVI